MFAMRFFYEYSVISDDISVFWDRGNIYNLTPMHNIDKTKRNQFRKLSPSIFKIAFPVIFIFYFFNLFLQVTI